MIRLASALLAVGMIPLVQVLLDPTGATATRFTFFGMPAVGAGILVYLVARLRGSSE